MSNKYLQNDKNNLLNSIGTEVCWGWSPAIDFTKLIDVSGVQCAPHPEPPETSSHVGGEDDGDGGGNGSSSGAGDDLFDNILKQLEENKKKEAAAAAATSHGDGDSACVNVLLVGAGDIRHILPTVASLRVDAESGARVPTYHFYLYEPNLRTHCRHLFFIQWLLDSMFALEELEERVLMFLDVYGNTLLRDMSAAQFRNVAQRLIKSLEKDSGELAQLVDFGEMKHKERDFVEEQLRYWVTDSSSANLKDQWDHRVRQEMAERYDNRDNIIDWDFVFHLTEYTNLLKFPEYRTWRNTGIAFDVCHINPRRGFKYDYHHPNKSLCHFDKKGRGAFLGDVKNGPFFAFGTTTENEHIRARTTDGTCKYGNGVISMHNLRAWLYALLVGAPWPWADHAFAWDDPANYNYIPPNVPKEVQYQSKLPRIRFSLIGLDFDRFVLRAKEEPLRGLRFDAAFVGTACTHLMSPEFFQSLMRETAVVVAETAKFIVAAEDEAKKAYEAHIVSLANAGGWTVDEAKTALLHKNQPSERRRDDVGESAISAAQQLSRARYESHFQVALKKKK